MYEILISVIACYGTAAVVVHLAKRSTARKAQAESHYILMTQDDESQLEHCIRSLQAHSRRSGKSMRITIWDQGSKDDTVLIARYCGNGVSWVREPSELRSPQETVITAGVEPEPTAAKGRLDSLSAEGELESTAVKGKLDSVSVEGKRESTVVKGKLESVSAEGKRDSVPAESSFERESILAESSFERESLHDFDVREFGISGVGLPVTKLDDSERELIERSSEGVEPLESTPQPRGETEAGPDALGDTQGHGAADGSRIVTSHGGTPLRSGKVLSSEGKEKILWSLRFYGIISESDQPVMIDLKNIEDLNKLPFRANQEVKGYGR
ncbi:hypothetical protein SAMN05444162_2766 [Paenibacillaceae bacterium GAS479]|nr:hypothetical protein SAMN05444162_2766 [Paenibacillaceae bacterium GAS479]